MHGRLLYSFNQKLSALFHWGGNFSFKEQDVVLIKLVKIGFLAAWCITRLSTIYIVSSEVNFISVVENFTTITGLETYLIYTFNIQVALYS